MEINLNQERLSFDPNVIDQAPNVYIAQNCEHNINVGAINLQVTEQHTLFKPTKQTFNDFRTTISQLRDGEDVLTPLLDFSKDVRFDTCSLKPIDSRNFQTFLQQHLNGGLPNVAGFEYLHLSLSRLQNSNINLEFPFTSGFDMCHILSLQIPFILHQIFNDVNRRGVLFTRGPVGWNPFRYLYLKLSFYYGCLKRNLNFGIGDGGIYVRIPMSYDIPTRQWSLPRPHIIYNFLVECINDKYGINNEIMDSRSAPGIDILEQRPINSDDANYGFNLGNFNIMYFRPLIIFDTYNDALDNRLRDHHLYPLLSDDLILVDTLYNARVNQNVNYMGMPSIAYYTGDDVNAAPQAPISRSYFDGSMTNGVIPKITGKRYFRKNDPIYATSIPALPNQLVVYGSNRNVYAYKLNQNADDLTALTEVTYLGGGRMFNVREEIPDVDIPLNEEVEPLKKKKKSSKRKRSTRHRRSPQRYSPPIHRHRSQHVLRQNPKRTKYGKRAYKFVEKKEGDLTLKTYLCSTDGACGLYCLLATNEEKLEKLFNLKHVKDIGRIITKLIKKYKIDLKVGTCAQQLVKISDDAHISSRFFNDDRSMVVESRRCKTHPYEEIFNFILKDDHWYHCEQEIPKEFSCFDEDEITLIPSDKYYSVKKLNSKYDISFEKRDQIAFDVETDNDYTSNDPEVQNEMRINTISFIYYSDGKIIEKRTFCLGVDGCTNPLESFARKIFEIIERRWNERLKFPGVPKWRLPLYICAFNGGGFDYQFIIRYFCECKLFANSNYNIPTIRPTTRFKCLSFQRRFGDEVYDILKFHDLCQIVNMSLEDCFQNFVSKEERGKDIFPIDYYKNKKTNHLECLKQKILKADINDIPPNKRKGIDDNDLKILECFEYVEHLTKYCMKDVEVLRSNYIAVNKAFNDICNERHLIENEKPFCILEWDTANQLCQSLQIHMMKPIYKWNKKCPTQAETNLDREEYSSFRKQYLNDLNKHTVTLMRRPTAAQNEFIRKSIFGGKSLPRVTYCNSIVGTRFENPDKLPSTEELLKGVKDTLHNCKVLADFKGQYPSTHNFGVFPFGRIKDMSVEEMRYTIDAYNGLDYLKIEALPLFVCDVTLKGNYNDIFPSNVSRYKDKLIWDNFDGRKVLTNVHLLILLQSGCEILAMHKCLKFEMKGPIFREGQMFFTKQKEYYKKQKKFGLEALSKLMGNAFYGGLIKREYNNETIFLTGFEDPDEDEDRHSLYDAEVHGMLVRKSTTKPNEFAKTPSYQGAFTLSYAKLQVDHLINVIMRCARYMPECIDIVLHFLACYGDTDSLLIPYNAIARLEEEGYFHDDPEFNGLLGRLSCDINKNFSNEKLNFAIIFESFLIGPKFYYLRYLNPDTNEIGEKFKMKGIKPYSKIDLMERDDFGRAKCIKTWDKVCGEAIKDFYWTNLNRDEDHHYTLKAYFERIGALPIMMPSENTPFVQTPFVVMKIPTERELQFDAFNTRPRLENLRLPWTVTQQLRNYEDVEIPKWLEKAVAENAFYKTNYEDPIERWYKDEEKIKANMNKLVFSMDDVSNIVEPLIDLNLIN